MLDALQEAAHEFWTKYRIAGWQSLQVLLVWEMYPWLGLIDPHPPVSGEL